MCMRVPSLDVWKVMTDKVAVEAMKMLFWKVLCV
jgi:hypothetical protein